MAVCSVLSGCVDRNPTGSTATSIFDDGIVVFYSSGCPDCDWVKQQVVPVLEDSGSPDGIQAFDIGSADGLERLGELERHFDVRLQVLSPVLVVRGKLYANITEIRQFHEGELTP